MDGLTAAEMERRFAHPASLTSDRS